MPRILNVCLLFTLELRDMAMYGYLFQEREKTWYAHPLGLVVFAGLLVERWKKLSKARPLNIREET